MTKQFSWGLLIIRIFLGVGFTIHGFDKFHHGIGNIAHWFSSIGLPGILAYGVALLEVMGGISLIAGLATRLLACLFTIVMVVAILKVKLAMGFLSTVHTSGYELELTYLVLAMILLINGSRLYSIDQSLFPKQLNYISQ